MANLSPFQKGYGSLQIFSVCQPVPSGAASDFLLTGLRRDSVTANAPGIFRENPLESSSEHPRKSISSPSGWRAGHRLPEAAPKIVFNIIDQGDLDDESNPVEEDGHEAIVIAPEVVHLSRFASRYRLYLDEECPSRVALCLRNADVAESLSQSSLAHMWRMVASMLESTGQDSLPDVNSQQPQNLMQFVIQPTIKALLEERADAGDVQTCVALSEILEVVRPDQTVRIPGLEINLVREWYLSYIDLLRDMCLFSHATYLIRSCKDPYIGALNQQSTT
jgi:WD repeat-containing protein 24